VTEARSAAMARWWSVYQRIGVDDCHGFSDLCRSYSNIEEPISGMHVQRAIVTLFALSLIMRSAIIMIDRVCCIPVLPVRHPRFF